MTEDNPTPEPDGVSAEDWVETPWDSMVEIWTAGVVSPELFGMLIAGGVIAPLYVWSDDLALPTVVLILISSALVGLMPPALQQVAYGIMVVGLVAALFEIGRRYFL